jgi:hypothetical protein
MTAAGGLRIAGFQSLKEGLAVTTPVSSDWPMFHHDSQRTGAASGAGKITSTASRASFWSARNPLALSAPSVSLARTTIFQNACGTVILRCGGSVLPDLVRRGHQVSARVKYRC